jgi:hypothetical protein
LSNSEKVYKEINEKYKKDDTYLELVKEINEKLEKIRELENIIHKQNKDYALLYVENEELNDGC